VVFNNVKVSTDDILGQLNQGWQYLEKVLDKAAVAVSAEMSGRRKSIGHDFSLC